MRKKNSSVGYAFGSMKNIDSKDIPITLPPRSQVSCLGCGQLTSHESMRCSRCR
jgi:hypothetical protein